jgi:SNF2 family DNA or RNA helicase
LDDGDTYGDNFYKFRNRYFVELPCGWVMRRGMKKQALRLLKGTAFVRLKKNCLDLPPKIYQYHTCPLKGKQLKHYRALQKEWLTLLKSGEEVGTIWKIAQNTLLWEVCNGFLNKDGETVAQFNTGKDDLLLSSLEELLCWPDKKIIIWAWFHHSIERIRALLTSMGVPHVWLHGKVSSRVATRAQRLFNGNRRVRVFVGQQASGGFGLNLQKSGCSDVLYYDRSQWVLHRQQSEDRVHRIGMPDRSPVYRDLIVEDSIDWKIYRSVKAGHDFSLEVQDFLATL